MLDHQVLRGVQRTRLCAVARSTRLNVMDLAEATAMTLSALIEWITAVLGTVPGICA